MELMNTKNTKNIGIIIIIVPTSDAIFVLEKKVERAND